MQKGKIHSYFRSAVLTGNLKDLQKLIATHGLSYAKTSENGNTLLCEALMRKQMQVAKLLINSGAEVDSRKASSKSALHLAAAMGDVEIIKMLVDRHADVNRKFDQTTPLLSAVYAKNIEVIEFLIEHGASFNPDDSYGLGLLHVAVEIGNLEIVESLLNHGFDVNSFALTTKKKKKDKRKRAAALHVAVEIGSTEIVKILLRNDASVNVRRDDGYTPLHLAAEKGHSDIANYLINEGHEINACANDGSTPLSVAIKNRLTTVVELLLHRGARIDTLDQNGHSILRLAVKQGCFAIAESVLKYFPVESDKTILRAVVNCCGKNYTMIIDALLKNGLTVNPEDANSDLLHIAVKNNHSNIVKEVLRYADFIPEECLSSASLKQQEGANFCKSNLNVNAEDKSGHTPLFYAIKTSNLEMTNLLLIHKASVTAHPELLHFAVKKRRLDIVKALLQYDVNINSVDESGKTAFHYTSGIKNVDEKHEASVLAEIAELLLRRGADVNAKDNYSRTTLISAIHFGNFKVVEQLLKYDVDVNTSGPNNVTPLHECVGHENALVCKMLLNKGADVNAQQADGTTALHIAAGNSDVSIVKILLDSGANVNSQLTDGTTALHISAAAGNWDLIDLFKARGVIVFPKNKEKRSECSIKAMSKAAEVRKSFLETLLDGGADCNAQKTDGTTTLHILAENKENRDLVELLVARGANVNAKKIDSTTALHIAVEQSDKDMVKLLLDCGADVNAQQMDGTTALHIVVNQGEEDMVELLLDSGADGNAQQMDGTSALHIAVEQSDKDMVELLLDSGADVNAQQMDGTSALHIAVEERDKDMVKLLLHRGAHVNDHQMDGTTALHISAKTGCGDLIKLLVTRGANVNGRKSDGTTPLHVAARSGRNIDILLDQGAIVDCKTNSGATPLSLAFSTEHCQSVRTLLKYGADINLKDEFGRTQLQVAYYQNNSIFYLTDVLKYHPLKLHAANLYLCEENLNFITDIEPKKNYFYKNFNETAVKTEIAAMKNEKILDTDVTFYDILTNSTTFVAKYMVNERIVTALKSGNVSYEFPQYAYLIELQVKRGLERRKLLEEGHFFYNSILNAIFEPLPHLPADVTEKIIEYLSNDNLRILKNAGESLGVRIPL